MSTFRIAVLVGSLRNESVNAKLAVALEKLAPSELAFDYLPIGNLPLYNQDDEQQPGAAVEQLRASIRAADGLLLVTPEYNRSVPGVLKNAIDHASRPWGKNAFAGKPAAVIGASPGPIGTAIAQQHLRAILGVLDVPVMAAPEAYVQASDESFDADGSIAADKRAFLKQWVERFAGWVALHNLDLTEVQQAQRSRRYA
jgi:chromate reductase, NAD(P)H dehydrogenase (quinone)